MRELLRHRIRRYLHGVMLENNLLALGVAVVETVIHKGKYASTIEIKLTCSREVLFSAKVVESELLWLVYMFHSSGNHASNHVSLRPFHLDVCLRQHLPLTDED